MRTSLKLGVALALPFALGACDPMTATLLGVNAVSFAMTDKTPIDHVASWVTGLDCSTHQQVNTHHYCSDPSPPKVAEAPLYCYRTLANVTCYKEPDPTASSNRLVQ